MQMVSGLRQNSLLFSDDTALVAGSKDKLC